MNKSEVIERLTERLGDRHVAAAAVEGLVDIIHRSVAKGEKVTISGFGTFEKHARPARQARNPRTGEAVRVKKTTVAKFRPGTTFKGVAAGTVRLGREPRHQPLLPAGITSTRALGALQEATGMAPAAPARRPRAAKAVTPTQEQVTPHALSAAPSDDTPAPTPASTPASTPAARGRRRTAGTATASTAAQGVGADATDDRSASASEPTSKTTKASTGATKARRTTKSAAAAKDDQPAATAPRRRTRPAAQVASEVTDEAAASPTPKGATASKTTATRRRTRAATPGPTSAAPVGDELVSTAAPATTDKESGAKAHRASRRRKVVAQ